MSAIPRLALPLALIGLLPACAERAEAPAPDPGASPVAAGAAASAPATRTATPGAALPLVPARFHGIWDSLDAPCDPATDMRLEIAERGVTFYESHGAVTALTVESPVRITAELAMKGEGESWTTTRTFTLGDEGTILTASGSGDTGTPRPLKRCA